MFAQRELDLAMVARELGDGAVNQAIDRLEVLRDLEKSRRENINAAEIVSLKAELALCTEKRDELCAGIRRIPKPGPSPRQSRTWYVAVALILFVAGFAFAHLALTPFGINWEVWPIAIALSVVCAYATDEALEKCSCERLVMGAAIVSFAMSLAGLLVMALVRGDILILFLKNALASGGGEASGVAVGNADAAQFYENAAWKLRLFFALLAVAMELATGLAIYGVRKIGASMPDGTAVLQQQVHVLEADMIRLLHRIEFLTREAEIFRNEFTRDFYLGLIMGAARRSSKHVGPVLGILLFTMALWPTTLASQSLDAMVGIDLSLTSSTKNYDGGLEHEKNVDGIARLIRMLPAAARFRVMGITDQSFSRPLMLLDVRIPKDRGPLAMIDQVAIARGRYAAEMNRIGRASPPRYPQTDVIGFMLIAADLLQQAPQARKVLVVFSDMRHSAPQPDIETPRVVPVEMAMRMVEGQNQIADLRNVEVYVYGAHAGGKDAPYWQSLRTFWTQYFAKCGAILKRFSMMRDLDDLNQIQSVR